MWNLLNRTRYHTNNHSKGAHHHRQDKLAMCHLTIWNFTDVFWKVQKGRDTYYKQLISGHSPSVQLKKYRKAEERIAKIVSDYGVEAP